MALIASCSLQARLIPAAYPRWYADLQAEQFVRGNASEFVGVFIVVMGVPPQRRSLDKTFPEFSPISSVARRIAAYDETFRLPPLNQILEGKLPKPHH
jgi:hypothetical protein